MKKLIEILRHNTLIEWICRLCIGSVFLYASIHKIIDPGSFAKIIYGYGLLPDVFINLTAIVLPYLEFFIGLFLMIGVFPRSSAVLAETLLLVFIIAISVNLIRGHEFDCGCFSFKSGNHEAAGVELLVRDVLWFIVGLVVAGFNSKRKFTLTD